MTASSTDVAGVTPIPSTTIQVPRSPLSLDGDGPSGLASLDGFDGDYDSSGSTTAVPRRFVPNFVAWFLNVLVALFQT